MFEENKMPYTYWSKRAIMEHIQDRILVWSILYYELDTSVIPDSVYDQMAHRLVDMQKKYPYDAVLSKYYDVFSDYDGNTGCDLINRLSKEDYKKLMEKAIIVAHRWHEGKWRNTV